MKERWGFLWGLLLATEERLHRKSLSHLEKLLRIRINLLLFTFGTKGASSFRRLLRRLISRALQGPKYRSRILKQSGGRHGMILKKLLLLSERRVRTKSCRSGLIFFLICGPDRCSIHFSPSGCGRAARRASSGFSWIRKKSPLCSTRSEALRFTMTILLSLKHREINMPLENRLRRLLTTQVFLPKRPLSSFFP